MHILCYHTQQSIEAKLFFPYKINRYCTKFLAKAAKVNCRKHSGAFPTGVERGALPKYDALDSVNQNFEFG